MAQMRVLCAGRIAEEMFTGDVNTGAAADVRQATELARHLNRQGDDCLVYFYAPPRMYWDFGTLSFMARRVEGQDVFAGDVPQPEPSRCADFVFLPHRLDELDAIRARYPGGIETPVYSPADDRLLYTVYEWTNGEWANGEWTNGEWTNGEWANREWRMENGEPRNQQPATSIQHPKSQARFCL